MRRRTSDVSTSTTETVMAIALITVLSGGSLPDDHHYPNFLAPQSLPSSVMHRLLVSGIQEESSGPYVQVNRFHRVSQDRWCEMQSSGLVHASIGFAKVLTTFFSFATMAVSKPYPVLHNLRFSGEVLCGNRCNDAVIP